MYSSDTLRASLLAALLLLLVWPQAQAQSLITDGAAKAAVAEAPSTFGGSDLLYDQTGSVGSGVIAQYNATSTDFDALEADNFTVPNGLTWTLDVVAATGFYSGGSTTGDCARANVIIWGDMGAGEPDAQLFTFDDIVPFFDSSGSLSIGTVGIEFPQPVSLTAGDYWFTFVCEGDNLDINTAGRWNWQFNDDIGLEPDAQLRNDGGAFGFPVGWNDYGPIFGSGRNNASFALFGFESGTALLPELTIEQATLMATAPPDGLATRILTLRNTGTDELTYSIPEFDVPIAPITVDFPQVAFRGYPTLQKPVNGSVFSRTGMDAFGYFFRDNDEPDGPAYNFTDISGTGTALGLSDDGGTVVPLPFPFEFYGDVKMDVGVASNGYLTFGGDRGDFSNDPIPTGTDPNDIIAPLWDDLNPADAFSDDVYTQDMGDGRFIVQWNDVAPFVSGGSDGTTNMTFQVVLFDDGAIEFQYGDLNDPFETATIGIENADATDGIEISFNELGYASNGRAIRIERDLSAADFLTGAQPASGTLAPGEDVNVTVSFDAAGLGVGTYNDALDIVTNAGNVTVPAILEVVGPPEIFVDPLLLEATLESGQTETRPISITNTGLEDLEFSFSGYSNATAQAVPNFGPRSKVVADKGAESASNGTQSFGAGGPDGFGYVWVDSDEMGGPDVNFQDISGSGTEITDTDWTATGTFDPADEGFFDVALPFDFLFYGEVQTSIRVSTNGFGSFGTEGFDVNQFTNQPIPVADAPNGLLAPFWDDLNLATSGSVFYGPTDDGRFAIQFEGAARFADDANPNTFQIILSPDGTIEYQYAAMNAATLDGNTIGIESPDGSDGLQIAFNEAYIQSDFAILIGEETALVADVSPASGTVAPGETVTVTATVDAGELFAGDYADDLVILSNDPVRPSTIVAVEVTVTGDPAVSVDPTTIGFGEVMLGGSASETVTVTNTGTDELTINDISSDTDVFSVDMPTATMIAPEGTATFMVTFEPDVLAAVSGTVTVSTDGGDVTVSVAGVAAPSPVLSVTPESLDFTVAPGSVSDPQVVTLQNDGVGMGTFAATASVSGDLTTGPVTAELQSGAGEGLSAASSSAAPRTPGESTGTRTYKSGDQVTITHSESQDIVPLTGISCPTVPNSHFRVFDLSDFDITGGFDVTNVEFGIESMSFDEATEINLYTLSGDFVLANLTEVASATANVGPGDDLSIVSVDVAGSFDSGDVLVVEWFVPSARPFFGGNGAGESSPTYLQADGCNVLEPAPLAEIGDFPANHWVVNVTGTVAASADDIVTVAPATGTVAPAQNQDLEVTIDASGLTAGTYSYVIDIATNDPQNSTISVPVTVTVAGGVSNEDASLPTVFELSASVPNPAAARTTLRYAVPETSEVLIEVYDLMGRRVATLVDGEETVGRKTVQWDAGSLAGGVYVYRMTAGSFSQTLKMVVVR